MTNPARLGIPLPLVLSNARRIYIIRDGKMPNADLTVVRNTAIISVYTDMIG